MLIGTFRATYRTTKGDTMKTNVLKRNIENGNVVEGKIKVYVPFCNDSKVKGFWKDSNGVCVVDRIGIREGDFVDVHILEDIRQGFKQDSVFCEIDKIAIIWDGKECSVLEHRIETETRNENKRERIIETFLNRFGGCTEFETENGFRFVSFYNVEGGTL